MGLFDFMKSKPSIDDLQKDLNEQLAAADLSQFLKIHTTLVGVTLKNPDGSDRQQIISQLKPGDALLINPHLFKDDEAIPVMATTGQIAGHLSAILTERLFTEHKGARMFVIVSEVTGGGPEQSYGCNVDVFVE